MKPTFAILLSLMFPAAAAAQAISPSVASASPATDNPAGAIVESPSDARDAGRKIPIVAYAYTAYGASAKTIGVQAYSLGLLAADQDRVLGGGAAIWWAPIERLTLVVDGQRNVSRDFAPSAAGIVRLYGNGREGLSLGALGKFKIDGFGKGRDGDEVESELEVGALASFVASRLYLDANAMGGQGLGDDGETDAEARLRLGYDLGSNVRFGLDGQARVRVRGPRLLPNGRTWDFAVGPQVMACFAHWFGAFTAGPTTMGLISKNVGGVAMLSVGGTVF
ncbi:MAG TPA: hypothetical protein VJT73_08365 [Polyangiaceae bacterium]|nr:hypothetical protein [Polyangiaceae bacterium]